MKRLFTALLLLTFVGIICADEQYAVTARYNSDDQGNISNHAPYNGSLLLKADGTYQFQIHVNDTGRWKYIKAGEIGNTMDMIQFQSNQGYQFFAYVQQNQLAIWINKSNEGLNQWVQAEKSNYSSNIPTQEQFTGVRPDESPAGMIANGVFTNAVMYGKTSAMNYLNYYEETGEFSADESGFVLYPDGSFYLSMEYGATKIKERGKYQIQGDSLNLYFDQGSPLTFKLERNGTQANLYNNGMLISEYWYLGTVKR